MRKYLNIYTWPGLSLLFFGFLTIALSLMIASEAQELTIEGRNAQAVVTLKTEFRQGSGTSRSQVYRLGLETLEEPPIPLLIDITKETYDTLSEGKVLEVRYLPTDPSVAVLGGLQQSETLAENSTFALYLGLAFLLAGVLATGIGVRLTPN